MKHVEETTWERLALGELSSEARAETLRHVVACPRCRTLYRGLRALERRAGEAGLLPAKHRASRRRTWIAAAAAVAVAAAIALVVWNTRGREERTVRGGGAPEIAVSVRVGRDVTWDPVDGATSYAVEVFAGDGLPAWTGRATAPHVAWPALAAGGYRLRVTAHGRDGATLATSRIVAAEVPP